MACKSIFKAGCFKSYQFLVIIANAMACFSKEYNLETGDKLITT